MGERLLDGKKEMEDIYNDSTCQYIQDSETTWAISTFSFSIVLAVTQSKN